MVFRFCGDVSVDQRPTASLARAGNRVRKIAYYGRIGCCKCANVRNRSRTYIPKEWYDAGRVMQLLGIRLIIVFVLPHRPKCLCGDGDGKNYLCRCPYVLRKEIKLPTCIPTRGEDEGIHGEGPHACQPASQPRGGKQMGLMVRTVAKAAIS